MIDEEKVKLAAELLIVLANPLCAQVKQTSRCIEVVQHNLLILCDGTHEIGPNIYLLVLPHLKYVKNLADITLTCLY